MILIIVHCWKHKFFSVTRLCKSNQTNTDNHQKLMKLFLNLGLKILSCHRDKPQKRNWFIYNKLMLISVHCWKHTFFSVTRLCRSNQTHTDNHQKLKKTIHTWCHCLMPTSCHHLQPTYLTQKDSQHVVYSAKFLEL